MLWGKVADPQRFESTADPWFTADEWSTVVRSEGSSHVVLVVEPCRDLSVVAFECVLSGLPTIERTRVEALQRWPDRLNSAIGWHLLHRMSRQHGMTVYRDIDGRPRADPPSDVGLSHSDRWVAVALSRPGRIGVDIEAIRSVSMSLERRCLTAYEMAWLNEVEPGPTRDRRFFRVWTAKEAYLKALGVGLSVDPRDVTIDCYGAQPALLGEDAEHWEFTSDSPTPGFCMTVCAGRTS